MSPVCAAVGVHSFDPDPDLGFGLGVGFGPDLGFGLGFGSGLGIGFDLERPGLRWVQHMDGHYLVLYARSC